MVRALNNAKKSWKTTLGGLLLAAGPMIAEYCSADFDGWAAMLAALGGALVGTQARDNDVSSRQAGADG